MASLKAAIFPVLLLAIFLLSSPAHCDDEDDLLLTLNSHRAYLNLPKLVENDEAECLANRVAKNLSKLPCKNVDLSHPYGLHHDITDLIEKCDINVTHTKEGVVLPVCVPDLDTIQVFTNYTRSQFHRFINSSKFAQVGLACNKDWMVVILATNNTDGDFALSGTNSLVSSIGFGHCLVTFLLGLLVYIAY